MSKTSIERALAAAVALACLGCPTGEDGNPPPLLGDTDPYVPPLPTAGGAGTGGAETGGDTDGVPPEVLCNLGQGVCSEGEKCVPVGPADPLGYSPWSYAACRPLVGNPRAVGATCSILEGMSDGVDDCVAGAMCYSTDVIDRVGRCVELCPDNTCGSGVCVIDNAGALPICLPACDPLDSTCGPGEGCLPSGQAGVFACHALQSGPSAGFPCSTKNGCGERDVCVPSELAAQSPGTFGYPDFSGYTCARYCDLEDVSEADCGILGLGTYSCIAVPMFGSAEVGVCQRQDD